MGVPTRELVMKDARLYEDLGILKDWVGAIACVCLFLYSLYLVVDAYLASKPLTLFHFIIPMVLLVLCVGSARRLPSTHRAKKKGS